MLEAFDIVGFDRRGTGLSRPAIDCIDDYDHFDSGTDITPDDDAERQQIIDLAAEFADACVANNAEIIEFIGTNNAARDIDSIRQGLGEDEISYYSYWDEGYGSELAGVWATMFPTTVRAVCSMRHPIPRTTGNQALVQAEGYEHELARYLAECSADPGCAFHNDGDAEAAFDELMLQLDATPIPSNAGRPDLSRGVALTAVTRVGYENNWPYMSAALDSAQHGSGAGIMRGYDIYFNYNDDGTWSNYREQVQTISCMDTEERPTVARPMPTRPGSARQHPACTRLTSPATTSARSSRRRPIHESRSPAPARARSSSAAPTTPTTPLQGTRNMAEALADSYLIVVDDSQCMVCGHRNVPTTSSPTISSTSTCPPPQKPTAKPNSDRQRSARGSRREARTSLRHRT